MKTTIRMILLAGMLLIFEGCVTLYKPNAIHSPMLREKGEMNAAASLALSGCGLYNLQAAYALSDHVGIMAAGMYHNRNANTNDTTVEKLNIYYTEVGAGYFRSLGKIENTTFQCYGGGGYGHTTDVIGTSSPTQPEVNAQYFNVFVQPGIIFSDENYRVAIDVRTNYVRLFDINAYLYERFEWWNTDYKYYKGATLDFLLVEPTLTLRLGKGRLQGLMQVGVTVPTYHAKSYFDVNTSSMLIFPLIKLSAGVSYSLGGK